MDSQRIAKLEKEITNLRQEVGHQHTKNNELQTQNNELQTQMTTKHNELQTQNNELQTQMTTKHNKLQTQMTTKNNELQTQNNELQTQITKLEMGRGGGGAGGGGGGPGRPEDEEAHGEALAKPKATHFQSFLHGGTSTLLSSLPTVVVFPVYKTVFRQQIHNTSVRHAVEQLYGEGLVKLYRGVVPPLLMRTLNGMLLYGVQDNLLHLLSASPVVSVPPSARPALAGLGAGVVEALVFTPFERVQNVLQNGQNDRSLPTRRSVLERLRSEGPASGFYRGFLPVAARNTLGSCLYFGLKGPLYEAVEAQGLSPMASSFASGTLTSMAVSLPLYPLSVLVANMQAQVGGETAGAGACWRRLWDSRQRRVALLYRGGSLVILRSCITWGITTAIYDQQQRRAG